MSRAVRLRDIAQYLGISVSTVSLALREAPQIAEETRERVMDAAQSLGYTYRQRPAARVIGRVAFVSKLDPDNIFYAAVLSGVESECRRLKIALDYSRLDTTHADDPQRYEGVGGLVLAGTVEREVVMRLSRLGLPLVLLDVGLPALGLDRILIDNVGGAYRSVQHLYGLGHRRIAFLQLTRPFTSLPERLAGYRLAVGELGLDEHVIATPTVQVADVAAALAPVLQSGPPFTGLVAANDLAAISAQRALEEAGVRVPDDVSLVGFDDLDVSALVRPGLTTCRVYRELLGALAVRRLIERAADPDTPPLTLTIDAPLIERHSTAPLAGTVTPGP